MEPYSEINPNTNVGNRTQHSGEQNYGPIAQIALDIILTLTNV
jgi:hypothetical protein